MSKTKKDKEEPNLNTLAFIRDYYRVPAFRSARIKYTFPCPPQLGIIVGAKDERLLVRLDDNRLVDLHPTFNITYLGRKLQSRFFWECSKCEAKYDSSADDAEQEARDCCKRVAIICTVCDSHHLSESEAAACCGPIKICIDCDNTADDCTCPPTAFWEQ